MAGIIVFDEFTPWPDYTTRPTMAAEEFSSVVRTLFAELLRQLFVSKVRAEYRTRNKFRRSTVRRMRRKWHGG